MQQINVMSRFAAVIPAVALAASVSHAAVFTDTFGTSTLNSATPAAPTATATNYQVLSSKNALASSIAPGSLQLNMGNTSSGFGEIQALFATSPVTLASAGQYVQLTMTFTASGVNQLGNSTLNVGLYNSGGNGPVPGTSLNNGQLDDPGIFTTGNAAGWLGYVSRIGTSTSNTTIFTRPAQVGETSAEAQDALFANAGGGAFDSPTGTTIATSAANTGVTFAATTYTFTLKITNNGSGLDIMYDLNNGTSSVATLTGADAAPLTTSFDALAFGFRGTDSTGPFIINASSIVIDSNVAVPEPASLTLIGCAALAMCRRRRSVDLP